MLIIGMSHKLLFCWTYGTFYIKISFEVNNYITTNILSSGKKNFQIQIQDSFDSFDNLVS